MQIKTLTFSKISIAQFGILLAIVLLAPLLGNQLITGSIVNAALFLATVMLGWPSAIAIGALPSLIATMAGTLPSPLIPMIPFIITGNAILITAFFLLKNKNYWLGIISAGVLKFLFLYATSATLFQFLLPQKLAPQIAAMMSWPQLTTALLGGIVAYLCLKMLKSLDTKTNQKI